MMLLTSRVRSFVGAVWGAYCPVVGILFATLISSTVDKLWIRRAWLCLDLASNPLGPFDP